MREFLPLRDSHGCASHFHHHENAQHLEPGAHRDQVIACSKVCPWLRTNVISGATRGRIVVLGEEEAYSVGSSRVKLGCPT